MQPNMNNQSSTRSRGQGDKDSSPKKFISTSNGSANEEEFDGEEKTTGNRRQKEDLSEEISTLAHLDHARDTFVAQITDATSRIKALTPKSGALNPLGTFLTTKLTTVADYLEDRTVADMGSELLSFARKHYLTIGLSVLGAGIGIVLTERRNGAQTASKGKDSNSGTQESKSSSVALARSKKDSGSSSRSSRSAN